MDAASSYFFCQEICLRSGGPYTIHNMQSAADYEMMLRILVKHHLKVVYIPQFIVKMRTGGVSNASVRNRLRANREDQEGLAHQRFEALFFYIIFETTAEDYAILKEIIYVESCIDNGRYRPGWRLSQ